MNTVQTASPESAENVTSYGPPLAAILLLLGTVFALGGSARADVTLLEVLRPVSIVTLGVGLITLHRCHLHGYQLVIGLAFATVALPALQLLPLSPQLWHGLPDRELVVEIDRAAGLGRPWRPLSLAPPLTINALGAALVPLAVLVLAIQLPPRIKVALLCVPLAFGAFGAVLALAQLAGATRADLYLFDIANFGSAIGFYANRNHQAIGLACLIPLGAAALQLDAPRVGKGRMQAIIRFAFLLVGLAALVPLILVTGSRAGLLVTFVALTSLVFIVPKPLVWQGSLLRYGWMALCLAVVVAVSVTIVMQERGVAYDRLLGSVLGDDLRVQIVPTLQKMWADHWVWGTGLGTFERVYQVYEQPHLLGPAYVNHAHNDWFELAITGGLPALLLMAIGMITLGLRVCALIRLQHPDQWQPMRWAALTCIIILLLASIADYPLRTPALTGLFALCLVVIFMPTSEKPA